MKIYKRVPEKVLRVRITEQGQATEYLSIKDTTQTDFLEFAKKVIQRQKLSMFGTGKVTNIQVREGLGGMNGKSVSFSFRGLHPSQVKDILINSITKPLKK